MMSSPTKHLVYEQHTVAFETVYPPTQAGIGSVLAERCVELEISHVINPSDGGYARYLLAQLAEVEE